MKTYNFDEIIERRGTKCVKYDLLDNIFGNADALPLWVADTDFRIPDFIVEALKRRMDHEILAYTFRPESYYTSIIDWMYRRHQWKINKEMISFSPGVVSGVTMLIMALTKPGDKVIIQPPVYFPFFSIVRGSDRKLVENPLLLRNGRYYFDFENLKKIIDKRTKLLILCSPHNPGGMVWKPEELLELGRICLDNGIMIISDEIHSDLVFKGNRHTPLPMVSEELSANCAVCMAPSKTFNIAGLSSALVIIPDKKLRSKYEKVLHTLHLDGGNIFGTIATEAAYKKGDEWLSQLMDYLEDNYLFLESFIHNKLPLVRVMKPEATFLVWLDFSSYGFSETEMSKILVNQAGVALNPGKRFGSGGEGYFRLNIGCPKAILEEGLIRIANTLRQSI